MTTPKHLAFLGQNQDLLVGPVLIVGSKQYPYDPADPRDLLARLGVGPVTGLDIQDGPGVDVVADICRPAPAFLGQHRARYRTILCLEVLTHLDDPFAAARTIQDLLAPGGTVLVSECIVRKLTRMPGDNWRFTYSGLQLLFGSCGFQDDRARFSIVRAAGPGLLPLSNQLPQVMDSRHPDETGIGYLLRRAHRKAFASGVFVVSRLMPETAVMAVGIKPLA